MGGPDCIGEDTGGWHVPVCDNDLEVLQPATVDSFVLGDDAVENVVMYQLFKLLQPKILCIPQGVRDNFIPGIGNNVSQ